MVHDERVSQGFFFFNDTATTEIYTLSLHDALPIFLERGRGLHVLPALGERDAEVVVGFDVVLVKTDGLQDRKSTRLNSSHANISYAVFCLKKKKLHCFVVAGPGLYGARNITRLHSF